MAIKTIKSAFDHYDRQYGKKGVKPDKKRLDKLFMALYILGDKGKKSVIRQDIERKCSISKNEIMLAIEELTEKNYIIDESTMSGMKWRLNRNGISYAEDLIDDLESNISPVYIPDPD
ncbi:CTP-dependent riboflavin kinase [Methanomicrobium sp. W14]|uniref:hypothetical protein n=1 Tax=Methanomicrobium sp. W14 TaxID=2817839 RepID=UPI001AE4C8B8|nr:hypothetical protein [Methanomicrobium sp. W14]MBP2133745.1 CTP-dependent riboflavin kinase [Methanomicrobium sp. W14]